MQALLKFIVVNSLFEKPKSDVKVMMTGVPLFLVDAGSRNTAKQVRFWKRAP